MEQRRPASAWGSQPVSYPATRRTMPFALHTDQRLGPPQPCKRRASRVGGRQLQPSGSYAASRPVSLLRGPRTGRAHDVSLWPPPGRSELERVEIVPSGGSVVQRLILRRQLLVGGAYELAGRRGVALIIEQRRRGQCLVHAVLRAEGVG